MYFDVRGKLYLVRYVYRQRNIFNNTWNQKIWCAFTFSCNTTKDMGTFPIDLVFQHSVGKLHFGRKKYYNR